MEHDLCILKFSIDTVFSSSISYLYIKLVQKIRLSMVIHIYDVPKLHVHHRHE